MVLRDTMGNPELARLVVRVKSCLRITLKIGDVETVFWKLVDLREDLPGIGDRFFLHSR